MMLWKITGTIDGNPKSATVEADSEELARKAAARSRMVVKSIGPGHTTIPGGEVSPSLASGIPEVPLSVPAPRLAPDYNGIVIGAGILRILAFVSFASALCVLIIVFAGGLSGRNDGEVAMILGAGMLGPIITGATLWLLASVATAVRDIARNSYR
jgi:hypothetical protein